MKLAAREGLGVAVMFRSSVAEELARKELCEITVVGVNVKFPVYLIFRKSKSFSRAHERLIETIRADFQRGISAFSADSAPQMPTLVPSG
jgi:DNA-binding transcriptional LysR family regulator